MTTPAELAEVLARPAITNSQTLDWADVEAKLHLVLPDDYRAFVSMYGSGEVDHFLLVFSPFAANSNLHLLKAGKEIVSIVRELRDEFDQYVPHPLFPERGGLLPWGTTRNGDTCYWLTAEDGDSEFWPVVVGTRDSEWEEFPGPMTHFLHGVLTRSVPVSLFPDNFPSSSPTFEAYA